MAEANAAFLRLCASTINSIYKGDPLELESFINSAELLDELATADQKPILVKFLKSKLAAKALESVRVTDATPSQILTSLKAHIKPENSKIIEGRMAALRAQRNSVDIFVKKNRRIG